MYVKISVFNYKLQPINKIVFSFVHYCKRIGTAWIADKSCTSWKAVKLTSFAATETVMVKLKCVGRGGNSAN